MASAARTTEFLINNEWHFNSVENVEIDTYSNLIRRRGNIDMPHLKLVFSGGVMTEINIIHHLGDEAIVRTTTVWER